MQVKHCPKCGEDKPLEEFGRNRSTPDGLWYWCRDCKREADRRYRAANLKAVREADRHRREANRETRREADRRYRSALRKTVLDHYGRECACCGSMENLTVDHVHGDGRAHRAEIGKGSHVVHRWLIANGFPDGFQVLCHPCNTSKKTGDRCRLDHAKAVA